jgi:16S rRNA processing protein RimM
MPVPQTRNKPHTVGKATEGRHNAIAAGRIVKTFGLGGELVVSLYDSFPDEMNGEPVFIEIDGIRTPFFFASFRRRGVNKALVVFEDMETEYRASELAGREFFLPTESEDEEEDEIYLEDLVGYTVRLQGHSGTGAITGYIDSEFNPLFEVEWNGRQVLIPAVDDFVVRFDESTRSLTLSLPEGLLDL